MIAPASGVSTEPRAILTRLRLEQMTDTLPERLATARQCSMPHVDFLEMVLADEVARRDRTSAGGPGPSHPPRSPDGGQGVGRQRGHHLRPLHLGRAHHAALRRRAPQRPDPRTGRRG